MSRIFSAEVPLAAFAAGQKSVLRPDWKSGLLMH
jgi:hypothetical protein